VGQWGQWEVFPIGGAAIEVVLSHIAVREGVAELGTTAHQTTFSKMMLIKPFWENLIEMMVKTQIIPILVRIK
jgi:hypothetical protein